MVIAFWIQLALSCTPAMAKAMAPQSFSAWKTEKIVLRRNRVARLKNQMVRGRQQANKASSKPQKAQLLESLDRTKIELRSAIEDLKLAQELSFDHYVAVYLMKYRKNPEFMKELAGKLKPEEVLNLLNYIQKTSGRQSNSSTL